MQLNSNYSNGNGKSNGTANGLHHDYTEDDYDAQIAVILNHAGAIFFQVRYDHVRHLQGDGAAACVLAHLLNLLRMKHANLTDRRKLIASELWFECPARDIQESLGMTPERQQRCVETLAKFGVLHTQKRSGFLLWVKINTNKLTEIETGDGGKVRDKQLPGKPGAAPGKAGSRLPGKPGAYICKESSKEHCRLNGGSVGERLSQLLGIKREEPPARQFADRLLGILNKHKKLEGRKKPHLPTWERQFQELLKIRSTAQVDKLLDWFSKYLSDRYTPKVRCAQSFLTRITDLEEARDRVEKPRDIPAQDGMPDDNIW
jgi:hypothetical protein